MWIAYATKCFAAVKLAVFCVLGFLFHRSHQALLCDAGDECAISGEDTAAVKAAGTASMGTIHCVEMPVAEIEIGRAHV